MHRPARPVSARGLRTAVLLVPPVLLVLALPSSAAATVQVTPAPDGCGVVVALTGLGDGPHTAVVRATAVGTGDPVPVVPEPAATPPPSAEPTPPAPVLSVERAVTGDGEVVVALDATAVPDGDPRVVVDVTVDGTAAPAVELALPGCGVLPAPSPEPTTTPTAAPSGQPTTTPTTTPSGQPTPTPAEPSTAPTTDPSTAPTTAPATGEAPAAEAPAVPTASPSAGPTAAPTAAPTATPTAAPPTAAPTAAPTASPTATPAPTASGQAPAPPAPLPPPAVPTPTLDDTLDQAYGAVELGTGTSPYLSLMSFAAAPQLGAVTAAAEVPLPVIAVPEGSAAGVLPAPQTTGTPLEDLLPQAPDAAGDDPVDAQLAAPDLATNAAADPLVDLAPAAFVLSASLGGLLVAGRRRST